MTAYIPEHDYRRAIIVTVENGIETPEVVFYHLGQNVSPSVVVSDEQILAARDAGTTVAEADFPPDKWEEIYLGQTQTTAGTGVNQVGSGNTGGGGNENNGSGNTATSGTIIETFTYN